MSQKAENRSLMIGSTEVDPLWTNSDPVFWPPIWKSSYLIMTGLGVFVRKGLGLRRTIRVIRLSKL